MEERKLSGTFKKADSTSKMAQLFEPKEDQNFSKSIAQKNPKGNQKMTINLEDGEELESDEEQDMVTPIKNMENYTLKDIILPKYSKEDLNQDQLKKISDLKELTENIISKTVKNRNNANIVKALVSKKKEQILL